MMEEDQKYILIIGGIEIFLPIAQLRPENVLQMQQQKKDNQQ
jgi:hypothetical protein